GLALLNGTQAMHAVGGLALLRAKRVAHVGDVSGAMSLEALKGTPGAFDQRLQNARPHPGQKEAAEHLLSILEGSEIRKSHLEDDLRVQDAYSLRCMPQVHGAVRGALAHCEDVLLIESASATDNPLVFSESGDVISGGNFHGAPLALALDYAAIALTTLMSISERRIDRLNNPDKNEGLPAFLAREPGLQSGFMIAHVAAASLLNEASVLAHPANVDNITTSGGKEDHVSMGMTSALKLRSIVELEENLDAIVRSLRELENNETLLVQSGKPVGKFRTHDEAPRVLIANSNLVGEWNNYADFNRLERMGLTMYGQMTAGSWIYIGSQGIVQGTHETFAAAGRKHFDGSLKGKFVLTGGLGGMGGAQPLAATMNGAAFLGVEVDPARIEKRLKSGYCDEIAHSLDEALKLIEKARKDRRSLSVG